jgi:hypothetical protein
VLRCLDLAGGGRNLTGAAHHSDWYRPAHFSRPSPAWSNRRRSTSLPSRPLTLEWQMDLPSSEQMVIKSAWDVPFNFTLPPPYSPGLLGNEFAQGLFPVQTPDFLVQWGAAQLEQYPASKAKAKAAHPVLDFSKTDDEVAEIFRLQREAQILQHRLHFCAMSPKELLELTRVTFPAYSIYRILQTWLLSLRLAIAPVFCWLCVYARRRPRNMALPKSAAFLLSMGVMLPAMLLIGWRLFITVLLAKQSCLLWLDTLFPDLMGPLQSDAARLFAEVCLLYLVVYLPLGHRGAYWIFLQEYPLRDKEYEVAPPLSIWKVGGLGVFLLSSQPYCELSTTRKGQKA